MLYSLFLSFEIVKLHLCESSNSFWTETSIFLTTFEPEEHLHERKKSCLKLASIKGHQTNGFGEIEVREIKTQMRILKSSLSSMSWILRHAPNRVTGKRQVVEFDESVHFRRFANNTLRGRDQKLLRGFCVIHQKKIWNCNFPQLFAMKQDQRNLVKFVVLVAKA